MKLLRVFISTSDKVNNQPLFEHIVFLAKSAGLAGATVLRGVMGYGASSAVHSVKLWDYSEKLPVIVEIIDEPDKIAKFYESVRPMLESMEKGCLVCTEDVTVLLYKQGISGCQ